ncbi:MAG TPA: bifunctional glutamate N-acetyltransferase/amino-acid acetyltransferase ArgJ [Chthoniobacteraceae bacterium]|jgi:glutamate N-acetyltransferase/amino-acid N-acetyltransferase|nr:bifunctional glutamate N-acetyltransferase/amino-acid acetyltransferase ArgJ [Chthoniobacteraceae bacterium]
MNDMRGGVTAPKGFTAGSIHCGVKESNASREDMAIIVSGTPAAAAGTFTTNLVKAAPVLVSMAHARGGAVRAIIANSGNANACTGALGLKSAKAMCRAAAKALGIKEREVLVCSTGRIGVQLPVAKMERAIAALPARLGAHSLKAAKAIMTSDTFPKEMAVECEIGGKPVRIGGIAKGAGMIDPNMATMLSFITTDAVIAKADLQKALRASVGQSFNCITVDGDMSTNDTVLALANGQAGNRPLVFGKPGFEVFQAALDRVTGTLARMIVKDGEGVSRFVTLKVTGARSDSDARLVARAIANSMLVKCAWYGGDPNWGRIMDAAGYSGARISPERIRIAYNGLPAVERGMPAATPAAKLRAVAKKKEFTITVELGAGKGAFQIWTTDLTPEYVTFNMGE